MTLETIGCVICSVACGLMTLVNLIVYWKINGLLKKYAEIEEEKE